MGTTSVSEIVRCANVIKGTFYVYYKDKKELISQTLTKQHSRLVNDILNRSYEAALADSTCWKHTFIDELITYCTQHPRLPRTVRKNIAPMLDTKEHQDMVFTHTKHMPDFPKLLGRGQGTEKKVLNCFLIMMEIVGFVCYNTIFFEQLDSIEEVLPGLRGAMFKMLERKEQPMIYKLGIDVGSTTPKVAILNDQDETMYKSYKHHKSKVRKMSIPKLGELHELLQGRKIALVITGSVSLGIADSAGFPFAQEVFTTAQAVRKYYPASGVVIKPGGEDAKTIFLQGTLEERMNSICTSGTGAFIDQMTTLLNVDLKTINQLSPQHTTLYPIISRCGVFARNNVQPLVNQGCEKSNLAVSIFQVAVDQSTAELAQGRDIEGNVLFLGGPLHFLEGLQERLKEALKLHDQETSFSELTPYLVTLGSAVYAVDEVAGFFYKGLLEKMEAMAAKKIQTQGLPPLFGSSGDYEEFKKRHTSASVECSGIHTYRGNAYLGIDISSTTTKLVLIDEQCRILYESYAGNMGNPVDAVQKELAKLYALMEDRIHTIHSAVMGYGEELVKHIFHLDIGVVETIAHYHAVHYFNPQVDFIIDIGSQDTKCSRIRDYTIDNILLNEACSSGCRSFIETFAKSMGYDTEKFARMELSGKHPVDLRTHCMAFMGSSIKQAQKNGASTEDTSTGLYMSVVKNASYKIVRTKSPDDIGKQIVVQGGTLLNDTVLRNLELELRRNVICPSVFHLMGAYGTTLIAKEKKATASSPLEKEDIGNFTHSSRASRCTLCTNHYNLTVNTFADGAKHIAGNKCECPATGKVNKERLPNLHDYRYGELLKPKGVSDIRGKVGIPLVLGLYDNLPFQHSLFTNLGYEVVLNDHSSKTLCSLEQHAIPSDTTCYPAKLVYGRIQPLIDKGLQTIFYPHMTYNVNGGVEGNRFNYPVVAYYPEVMGGDMNLEHVRFLYPYIYLEDKYILDQKVFEYFKARQTDIPFKDAQAANNHAYFAYQQLKDRVQEGGRNAITFARRDHCDVIVLVGCPYHAGPQINYGVHRLLNNLGFVVISEDSIAKQIVLPSVYVLNQQTFRSRMYNAAQYVVQQEYMELIQLVSFGCRIGVVTAGGVKDTLRSNGKLYTQTKINEVNNPGAMKIRCRSLQIAAEEREGWVCHM